MQALLPYLRVLYTRNPLLVGTPTEIRIRYYKLTLIQYIGLEPNLAIFSLKETDLNTQLIQFTPVFKA